MAPSRSKAVPTTAAPDPGDAFTLTVLGCDGSWPGPGGAGSGYLVRICDTAVVLDAGPGTFAILQEVIDPSEVDAVVISHHHHDHWTDLFAMDAHARFGARPTRGMPHSVCEVEGNQAWRWRPARVVTAVGTPAGGRRLP